MIDPNELFLTAAKLALPGATPSDLRRAVSTAYYALFHGLCRLGADTLAGQGGAEWIRVYRFLDHRSCRIACEKGNRDLGADVGIVSEAFVKLQRARHEADYDPNADVTAAEASRTIALCYNALSALVRLGPTPAGRALVLRLLIKLPADRHPPPP